MFRWCRKGGGGNTVWEEGGHCGWGGKGGGRRGRGKCLRGRGLIANAWYCKAREGGSEACDHAKSASNKHGEDGKWTYQRLVSDRYWWSV